LSLASAAGHVRLVLPGGGPSTPANSPLVADLVGYGSTAAGPEGTPAPKGDWDTGDRLGSIERKANATSTAASMSPGGPDEASGNNHDSQDNGADFVARPVRAPQNRLSPPE
jgi:hypothetical protein